MWTDPVELLIRLLQLHLVTVRLLVLGHQLVEVQRRPGNTQRHAHIQP